MWFTSWSVMTQMIDECWIQQFQYHDIERFQSRLVDRLYIQVSAALVYIPEPWIHRFQTCPNNERPPESRCRALPASSRSQILIVRIVQVQVYWHPSPIRTWKFWLAERQLLRVRCREAENHTRDEQPVPLREGKFERSRCWPKTSSLHQARVPVWVL